MMMRFSRFLIIYLIAFCCGFAVGVSIADAAEPATSQPAVVKMVPHSKFVKAVEARRAADKRIAALQKTLATGPDFEVSLQLFAIAYGQSWTHLRDCALDEGYGHSRRYDRENGVTNTQGSGATSSFQFMRGTFLSTPFAHLNWHRQDVQAAAAAWMFSVGRGREWEGASC